MKCPYCKQSVSFLSKQMNSFGRSKTCPQCTSSVRLRVGLMPVVLGFIPAVIASVVLKPWLGSLSTGIAVAALLLLSLRLRPAV